MYAYQTVFTVALLYCMHQCCREGGKKSLGSLATDLPKLESKKWRSNIKMTWDDRTTTAAHRTTLPAQFPLAVRYLVGRRPLVCDFIKLTV